MSNKLMISFTFMLISVALASAEDFDAMVNDATRQFTKQKKAADKLHYARLTLDSKGKVVLSVIKEGTIAKNTKFVMGSYDEKKKKWIVGQPIADGVNADIFTEKGKTLRARMSLADDNNTIKQIMITDTDAMLEMADLEFDGILKYRGAQTNGTGGISYVRLERDEKGKIIKTFPQVTSVVTKDTVCAMGKWNKEKKEWEAGDELENRFYNDIFKDITAKTIYVRMTLRDDRRGIASMLVTQIGEKSMKK